MITFDDIARTLGSHAEVDDKEVAGVSTLKNPRPRTLSFTTGWNDEVESVVRGAADTLFIAPETAPTLGNVVPHPRPRLAYAQALRAHFADSSTSEIASTASIADGATIGAGVSIGHFCVIEDGAVIADGASIGHHTVIGSSVRVGENTSIGTHCAIGGPGFGFEHDEQGRPIRIQHLGGVEIGANVEIGSHVVIARGTIESTVIGDHVKIDDTVFIAHNVTVGENSFIIAGAEVSGSVDVGRDVWISPEATIINKVSIGDRALVGIGAVVVKDVVENTIVAGVPAKERGLRFKDA